MTEREYDVVIIGSGAGGGTVAKELAPLAKSGARIAVLEWGPRFREEEFTGREIEMAARLYHEGGGVLTKDGAMTLAFGKAYGGSTVVYTGTSLVVRPDTVARWGVKGLDHADLARRSAKYMAENNVHLIPEEDQNENNRLFRDACRRLSWRVEQFPVNVKGCRGSGLCNLGCPNAAKQGTHRVQLPQAESAGVEVITNCKVERIEDRAVLARVAPCRFGFPSAWEPGEHRVKARFVVVCGGAVNTCALLLRSNLPARLPVLGKWLTTHPALILVAEHPRPITNFHGHPKSYYCDHFTESRRFLLETCMYFPFMTAKSMCGFGAPHEAMMRRFDRLQMILSLAIDPAREHNAVGINAAGEPVVDYTLADDVLNSLLESMRAAARIFFEAGAVRVHAPATERFAIERADRERIDDLVVRKWLRPGRVSISAAHLMGGARMGAGPDDSVTNEWGEVHGLPWLFVGDSALFPRCAEINPYLTIMALADRVAERVTRRLSAPGGR
ncbi:MAG: GMC family oxidoreductase [Planctomycetes bacterium]|nr:GMC family oxidoreductase [Planctomycetota bacterium]